MGIVQGLGLFPTFVRALSNEMFTEIDHEPWQARHSELTENFNNIF